MISSHTRSGREPAPPLIRESLPLGSRPKTCPDLGKREPVADPGKALSPGRSAQEFAPGVRPKTCPDLSKRKSISGLSRIEPVCVQRNALTSGFVNRSLRDSGNLFPIRALSISRKFWATAKIGSDLGVLRTRASPTRAGFARIVARIRSW